MSQTQKNAPDARKDPKPLDAREDSSVIPFKDLDALEATIPPTPLRDLLAADGASVYVLSNDAVLLEIVQEAGGDQYPVFPAQSWQSLREAIVERRCGIALLDIDTVKGAFPDRIAELAKLSPHLVMLVASTRDRADGLLNLLSQRKIHRLLIKPPTVGITRLLLESSVNRHIAMKQRGERASEAPATAPASNRLAGWPSWLLAGTLVLGTLAAVGVMTYMNRAELPISAVVTRPSERPAAQQQPTNTATAANAAAPAVPTPTLPLQATAPAPDAAIDTSADLDPIDVSPVEAATDPAGVTGALTGPVPAATPPLPQGPDPAELEARYADIETALLSDDLTGAEALLVELAELDPGSSRWAFLSSQLERARALAAEVAAAEAAAAVAAEAAAAPSEQSSLIGLARARLAQDQVVTPAGDSAADYYERARSINPTAPEIQVLAGELGDAVLTTAEIELAVGRFAAAESLFVMARDLGVSDADLAGLELSLALARESLTRQAQDALLDTARQRLDQGQIFTPAGQSALDAVLEVDRLNPGHPGLPQALDDLRAAIQSAATELLEANDWDRAAAAIDALARAGAPSAVVDPLDADLVFGARQEAYLAEAAPAGELSVVEFSAPVYPGRALNRGVEGWVDLEFVVDTQGIPRDIVVIGAEPPDLFEAAAVAAAEGYVFVPFERDGRVYERRAQVRIRFTFE